jgi:DNA-binding winged helix-turn-helix (wHTH) protein/tetratricopeptide (TPR) repeat protein
MTTLDPRETRPPIVLARTPAFRLGAVEVRPATRELIGPGGRERVEPRVMEVLVALWQARGEITTREDLIDLCWGGRIVGQDAINRVISKVRALGEGVGGGTFGLETIVKVGYRLIEGEGAAEGPLVQPQPLSKASQPDRRWLLAGGAGAAGLAAAGGWQVWRMRRPTVPAAALQLREQGVEAARLGSAESTAQAIGFLQQAVQLAPTYAEGWGALALAYQSSEHFLADADARAAVNRGHAAAERALQLDPRNASAKAALALTAGLAPFGAWAAAEETLRAVLAIDPQQFETLSALSRLLAGVGRTREAVAALDPIAEQMRLLPSMQYWRAYLLWAAGRPDESDQVIDRAMALWPRSYQTWFTRYWLYARTGRGAQALAMSADPSRRPLGIPEWNFALIDATTRALMTRAPADIELGMKLNMERARQGAGFAENAIEYAADVARLDEAFAVCDAYYLGKGFAIGTARYSIQQASYTRPKQRQTTFLFDPSCARLRADPRFGKLAADIGLAAYWKASGKAPDVGAT